MFKHHEEQIKVILSTANRILLNAGAGTAKTTVLGCYAIKQAIELIRHRISWAAGDAKVLLISLTNKAADETREAIEKWVNDENVQLLVGSNRDEQAIGNRIICCTIHSFAFRQLIQYTKGMGFSGFIVDNECNEEILNDILEDIKPAWRDDMSIKAALLEINALNIKSGKDLRSVVKNKYPEYARHTKPFIEILETLEQKKREDNIITYDDMVHRFFKLLHNRKIREQIFRKYPVIIVDEFQDTGSLQWKVIKKMVGPKSKLLCAGDEGQTIFTWAGASFYRFRHFIKRYPNSERPILKINRRSTEPIVSLSNLLIAQSAFATKKEIEAKKEGNKEGNKVQIINNPNKLERYEYIITQIERLVKDGIKYGNMAILYRSYLDLQDFKEFLSESGVPFQIFGDKSKRDRPIIKFIFSLIKIIESSTIKDADWKPVLMFLEGVGKKRVDQIIEWLKAKKTKETVYPKPYKFTAHLQKLIEFVNALKNSTASNADRLSEIIEYARKLPKVNNSIKEHIRPTLLKLAHECNSRSDIINKYNDRSYPLCYPVEDEPPYPDSYLTLSNIHLSKGDEFHTVFYLGTQDRLYEKYGLFKSKKKKEGELQLMNVAITRARRELHLLFPIDTETWRNNEEASNPWRFVRDAHRDSFDTDD